MSQHYNPQAKRFYYDPIKFEAALACGWVLEGKPDRLRLLTSAAVEYERDVESRFVRNVTAEQCQAMLKAGKLGWQFKGIEFEKTTSLDFPITIVLRFAPRQLMRITPDGKLVRK
jgi:hypothetical protein